MEVLGALVGASLGARAGARRAHAREGAATELSSGAPASVAPLVPAGAPHSTQVFDVTETFPWLCCCCTYSAILTLEPEEAVLARKSCFSSEVKRMPYGELGSVDKAQSCGCCHAFSSNLSTQGEGGVRAPMAPGCGCSGALVDEIVAELKLRMKGRGDTGNIQRAEDAIRLLLDLVNKSSHQEAKIDAVLQNMSISVPVEPEAAWPEHHRVIFQQQRHDVTNTCHRICTCGVGERLLDLEPEEAHLTSTTCCSSSSSRRPYGELGSVDANTCCCFHAVGSNLGPLSPGCGCEQAFVRNLADELKMRMKERGDTGNIQRQEEQIKMAYELLKRVAHQDAKINAIMGQMNIPVPPTPPPAQQAM